MSDIKNELISVWSSRRKAKHSQTGWISANAVCCHHNGQNTDTRSRGGLLASEDNGISYHCFNCGFTASWKPGRRINFKMRKLISWMGISDDAIRRLSLFALSTLDTAIEVKKEVLKELPTFVAKNPCPGRSITSWLNDGYISEENYNSLEAAINYLDNRGLESRLDQFYWSDDESLRNRVFVPFTWLGQSVGYSGRLFVEGRNRIKYLSSYPNGIIWGYDQQQSNAKFCIVVEGLLDAVSIDGLAVCTNAVSETQAIIIDSLDREVIVVPDRDQAGLEMAKAAIEYGWNVAFPDWGEGIKDVADAVARYGQLFTMRMILDSVETSSLKIQLMSKKWL